MIQVNLIPDLKAEFLKAQRMKRFVMGISFLVSAGFIAVVVLMFLYTGVWQAQRTDSLNAEIQELVIEYQQNEDLDKIVTVQKQLEALPELHNNKALVSRLITILTVVTPEGPEYRAVSFSLESLQIELVGTATTTAQVNTLANTIKNAVYTLGSEEDLAEGEELQRNTAFSNVILNTISNDEEIVNFSISLDFDDQMFNNHDEFELIIPEIDSTNSEVNSPGNRTDLFEDTNQEGEQQ